MLKGMLSVTFRSVNSPLKGVITFLSEKQAFKQAVILTVVFYKMLSLILASNKPFSSASSVKLLLSYSIFTLE